MEQVADTVSIIGHGRLLASGTVADLIRGGAHAATQVRVGVSDLPGALRILTEAGLAVRLDGRQLVVDGADDPADITRRLAHHELYVDELVPVRAGLESIFLQLTAGEGPGTHIAAASSHTDGEVA